MAGAPQGYIGRNPGDGRTVINRQTTHVTTDQQESFTMNSGYEVGFLDVYLNGIKQTETLDYTASDGSTINFSPSFGPVNGDVLEFISFETLNITNIKSARRNFTVGQDLTVDGSVTIGSSLTVASDLVVNGTFTTINTEILDVEDKTVGIASTSSPSNTTADGAGIVIYGGSDGDKSITWNTEKSNFVIVGGGVSIGTGVTISTPAANVLAFSVNSAEKARFNNFGAFTVGYEGEAWHESTYVGVLQAGSGAWIGQTPGAGARAEWVNNAYYDAVNTRWEYIAADEANRIYLENGELHLQSAAAGSADGLITWNERLAMTVGGDFRIGPNAGIGITISSSGNVDAIGIITASSFDGNLNASQLASGTVPTARLGSGTANNTTFLRGDSTFAVVNTNLVADTSPQLGGPLNTNGQIIKWPDSTGATVNRAIFGAGTDLSIYHDGTDSIIDNATGNLKIIAPNDTEAIKVFNDGTVNIGANADNVQLRFGIGSDLKIYHDGTDSKIINTTGALDINGTGNINIGKAGENGIKVKPDNAVELYYNNSKKFHTYDEGCSVFGNLNLEDSTSSSYGRLRLGNSSDLQIYHDGNNSYIVHDGGGDLYIQTQGSAEDIFIQSQDNLELRVNNNSDLALQATGNSGTALFHQGNQKIITTSDGAEVTGSLTLTSHLVIGDGDELKLGNSSDMTIWHSGSDFYMYNSTGQLVISNASGTGTGEGAIVFKTGNNNTRAYLDNAGNFYPATNDAYDLGAASYRWRNIYTNDLNLSNKGSQNDVDGTWGDYTIQEGESDLFLINNRSGKKFKFMLQEVS